MEAAFCDTVRTTMCSGRVQPGRTLDFSRLLCVIIILAVIASVAACKPGARHPITVSAAISLKNVLDAICTEYRKQHPGTEIVCNYGSTGTLRRQIEAGAPVDIFLAAAGRHMDTLERMSLLIPGTRAMFLKNQLVLITPRNDTSVHLFQDLSNPRIKTVIIGEPGSVPAGEYALQVITSFGLEQDLRSRFIYATNAGQILTTVALGNADAGITYQTDASGSDGVRIAAIAGEETHQPILYPAAVIRREGSPGETMDFYQYLFSSRAKEISLGLGFTLP